MSLKLKMQQPNKTYVAECNRLLGGRTINVTVIDKGELVTRSVHIRKTMFVHYEHGGSKLKRGTAMKFRDHDVLVSPIGAKLNVRKKGVKVDYGEIVRISSRG